MCKNSNNILKRNNYEYYLVKDLSTDITKFENKENNAKTCILNFITDLRSYLLKNQIINEKKDNNYVEQMLIQFLEKNGFVILHNSDNVYKWNNQSNIVNYNICKYLIENFEKNTDQFKAFMKMIEGFMLSNVLYMQFDNHFNQSLKNVEVYIDAPLLLRMLEFKNCESNRMAIELLELLKKQQAQIKCFEHNYKEVEAIIENYKNRKFHNFSIVKNDSNKNINEQTLEYFDNENFLEADIDLVLMDLKNKIESLGIKIVSCPDVTNNIKYNLNMSKMIKFIQSKYTKKAKEITIYNDILSINAINMLRKGEKFATIEQSKAVFVTLNYTLERYANEFLSLNEYNSVGLCINDTHLTSLLWVKNNTDSENLVKAKVLSSILAGFDLPNNMIEKIKKTLLKIEKYSPANINEMVDKILTSQTSHVLMEITGGDINKISENSILDALQNEKNKEIQKHLKTIEKVEKEVKTLRQQEIEREKSKNELIEEEVLKSIHKICIFTYIIYVLILVVLISLFAYIVYIETNIVSANIIIRIIVYIGTFLGYFTIAYNLVSFKRFKNIKNKLCNYFELKISDKIRKKYSKI